MPTTFRRPSPDNEAENVKEVEGSLGCVDTNTPNVARGSPQGRPSVAGFYRRSSKSPIGLRDVGPSINLASGPGLARAGIQR
jgi:hypothetical protein